MPPRLLKGTPGRSREVSAQLGMPGHTKPKVVASHAIFSWWIDPNKKSKKLIHSFQRYWWPKNSAIRLGKTILAANLWSRTFKIWCRVCTKKTEYFNACHFRLLPAKSSNKILQKLKNPFVSLFSVSRFLWLCKISETNEQIQGKVGHRHTDGGTSKNRQMSRCTEKFLGWPLLRVQKTKSLSVPFLKAPFKKPAATLPCDISHEMDGEKLVIWMVEN